ncbi:unnamed protein product [Malus baccata var. baccata]
MAIDMSKEWFALFHEAHIVFVVVVESYSAAMRTCVTSRRAVRNSTSGDEREGDGNLIAPRSRLVRNGGDAAGYHVVDGNVEPVSSILQLSTS